MAPTANIAIQEFSAKTVRMATTLQAQHFIWQMAYAQRATQIVLLAPVRLTAMLVAGVGS